MERATDFWRHAYQRHGGDVMAFLASRLRRTEEAEDLLHETFLRAMRAADLRDAGRVRPYLFSIAHHLSLNHLRRRREMLFSEGEPQAEAAFTTAIEPEQADAAARQGELARALAEIELDMTEPLRRAFRLGLIARLPYAEIATRTGWSLAQVKVNVHRARKRVVEGLAPFLENRSEP